jgi:regulator of sirC expression with transglutaminase-like and TPR domain
MNEKASSALIHLFSEGDPSILGLLEETFRNQGASGIETLRQVAAEAPEPARENAEQILQVLLEEEADRNFAKFSILGTDLETGVFRLAQTGYPGLDPEPYRKKIEEMRDQLRSRVSPGDPHGTLREINRYLFDELGFKGNSDNYYDPDNSFIHRVLDRKLGIPITLSVLYLLAAQPLGLPLAGVGMPGHFILKWGGGKGEEGEIFIDPFYEGRLLTQDDCVDFLVQSGHGYSPDYLKPVNARQILARMCHNLVAIYRYQNQTARADRYAGYAADLSA